MTILQGNLGADPELRYTNSGTAVCNFRMATNERFTDKNGEKQERTEWHRIVVWGKLAEICGQYLAKGRMVTVVGKLQTRKWEDRDGVTRYMTEIVSRQVEFLPGGPRREANQVKAEEQEVPTADLEPKVSQEAEQLLQQQGGAPF